ncbi:sensor histidine kinase [Aliikangiella sp. IMCC44653]
MTFLIAKLTGQEPTIKQYIVYYSLLISMLISLLFSFALQKVYRWGLDDASEHYLVMDAEYYIEQLINNKQAPANDEFVKFYLGFENLPLQYVDQVKIADSEPVVSYFESEKYFEYLLTYPIIPNNLKSSLQSNTVFVIHRFNLEQEKNLPGLSIYELALLFTLISIVIALTLGYLSHHFLQRPVNYLKAWIRDVSTADYPTKEINIPCRSKLKFQEFIAFSNSLATAINALFKITQKEQQVIQSISHELKTPIAIASAALDILDDIEKNENIAKKLAKIRYAVQQLDSTSTTILAIWRKDSDHSLVNINLATAIKNSIKKNKNLFPLSNFQFHLEIAEQARVLVTSDKFNILLDNLIRNSMQYTADKCILITANKSYLKIENSFSSETTTNLTSQYSFGYGFGLLICQEIVKQFNWNINLQQSKSHFSVCVEFCQENNNLSN